MRLMGNTYLFLGFDLDTAFAQIAWCGYPEVELHMSNLDKSLRHHIASAETIAQIAAMASALAETHHLPIRAIETSPSAIITENALLLAKALGVRIVTTGWAPKGTMAEAIDSLRPLADKAQELDVILAIKPHSGFTIYSAATVLELAQAIDSPALRINFDPTHIFRAPEDPAETVGLLSDYIVHSQFRDCENREARGPAEAQVAGRGAIDLPSALIALQGIGYDGPLSFLCVGAEAYTLNQCAALAGEHKGYMRRLLQEREIG
jgi:sugar phosphate isomerase/epimerase